MRGYPGRSTPIQRRRGESRNPPMRGGNTEDGREGREDKAVRIYSGSWFHYGFKPQGSALIASS